MERFNVFAIGRDGDAGEDGRVPVKIPRYYESTADTLGLCCHENHYLSISPLPVP